MDSEALLGLGVVLRPQGYRGVARAEKHIIRFVPQKALSGSREI